MHPYDFFTRYRVSDLKDRVFVGMWFNNEHRPRFDNIIAKAIKEKCHLEPYRVDEPVSGASIPVSILEGILNSRIVLFELSYITPEISLSNVEKKRLRNANVMYELGLAQAWRLPEEVIIIKEDSDSLPFDVSVFKVHQYNPNEIEKSIEQISEIINKAVAEIDRTKSIMVERAIQSLDSQCFSFIHSNKGVNFHETRYEASLTHIISRLLDLGIICLDTTAGGGRFHYKWTELGRAIIKNFGIEKT